MSEPTNGDLARQHTGTLARIARAQATHPKRTVIGGLLFFFVISFLAFGPLNGTLENKFSIPGSDAQKATDVLAAKFDARNGGVLQVVMVAPDGERLDTAERKAAIDAALAKASKAESATYVSGPFADDNQRFSKTDPRIGYAEVQFSEGRVPARPREDRGARGLDAGRARQGRHHDRVHRRRRAGAARAGRERVHRLRRRAARAADRVPHAGRGEPSRSCSR